MKKLLKIVGIALFGLTLCSVSANAGVVKGQKLFIKKMKKSCGFTGGDMAKKHSQAEWKSIYDGGKLSDELLKQCPNSKPQKEKYLKHMYDFFHNYANDSGNVPAC